MVAGGVKRTAEALLVRASEGLDGDGETDTA